MEEPGWENRVAQLLNLWEIRVAVLSSFVAHLLLVLLSSIRRRKASGVLMLILWLAYQFSSWVAPYTLSNLSLSNTSSRRQQLVAFWTTFLLHHLGGADNISAFSLEDNKLSAREALNVISLVAGASYVLYKHVYIGGGGGTLIQVSIIIFAMGAAKYVERAWALWQGNLGNIWRSSKKKQGSRFFTSDSVIRRGTDCNLDDEDALMVAHDMLPLCKRAMSDSSVDTESPDNHNLDTSRKIFTMRWDNMCKVVEMELSLMYDILYTKAAVVHTPFGYSIRIASPLAIGAATVLFGFYYNKEGQTIPDVIITYALLLVTLLLDTRWLLGALGSTWTHSFLHARPHSWLHHVVLCSGRWRRHRHFIVSLDLGRLCLTGPPRSPSSYRRWSGTIGQYNLLQECTRKIGVCSRAAKAIGVEDVWNEYQHSKGHKFSRDVKRVVFTRVNKVLRSTYEDDKDGRYSMENITMFWGQLTTKMRPKELKRFRLAFGREFQEDILVWHIATQIFLVCRSDEQLVIHDKNAVTHAKAIEAMSQHLMFLTVVRPYMLPGFTLRSLDEVTLKALRDVWNKSEMSDIGSSWTTGEKKLSRTLVNRKEDDEWGFGNRGTRLVSDGVNIAVKLLTADRSEMPKLLELVFNIWVDKLLYAATRCSRESHARQLGHGGGLTTIVWIMAEHAGPFQIGQDGPDEKEESGGIGDLVGGIGDLVGLAFDLPKPSPPDPERAKEMPQPHKPMWPQPPSPWDPMYRPMFGDGGHMMPPPKKEEPKPPPPKPMPPPKGLPRPESGEREDTKPTRAGRYSTLYPVD
ncbi:uncharacterized protein [Aegilops tauschii subsp. strangulata]|uniref:uncharacterized protein n=1 Tax=Aegilops tauschii subsp. strangulata TaxID=200361 RepID=UPI00098A347D